MRSVTKEKTQNASNTWTVQMKPEKGKKSRNGGRVGVTKKQYSWNCLPEPQSEGGTIEDSVDRPVAVLVDLGNEGLDLVRGHDPPELILAHCGQVERRR